MRIREKREREKKKREKKREKKEKKEREKKEREKKEREEKIKPKLNEEKCDGQTGKRMGEGSSARERTSRAAPRAFDACVYACVRAWKTMGD